MMPVLRCTIGGRAVAIPMEAVREVVRGMEPTAPLTGGTAVRGLLNVRGRVVPLVAWPGDGVAASGDQVVIVEDANGSWVGVGIEACGGLAQADALSEASVMIGQECVTLLQPDRLLAPTPDARRATSHGG